MYLIEQPRGIETKFELLGKEVLLITDKTETIKGVDNIEYYVSELDLIEKLNDDDYAIEFYQDKSRYDVVIFSFKDNNNDLGLEIYSIIEDNLTDTIVVNVQYDDVKEVRIVNL